tara:strand:+ start:157 stop:345 length:189 start_codon:yes stop_codon:yes gene_type:complete
MIIEKEKLKSIINEELNRLSEPTGPGVEVAEVVIEKFNTLNENQRLNFLETFFSYLKENKNI